MLRLIGKIIIVTVFLSGCTPVKMMVGVNEANPAEVKTGTRRPDVEHILGKCLWHVGVADGLSYNIYQFEREQPAKPVAGIFGLGLDYITLGSFELMAHPREFGQAKQVAVAYDRENRVAFVSIPWPARDIGPCRRQRYLLPENSGIPDTARPIPLNSLDGSILNTAILYDKDLEIETIDGHVPEEDVIELLPGRHEVKHHGYVAMVTFFSGRHYRMEHESFYGYARFKPFYFIVDMDSDETMFCLNPTQIHD